MKHVFQFLLFLCLITTFAASCTNHNDLKVAVKDSDDQFRFTAQYNPSKTERVQKLINKEIYPTRFEENKDWNISTILDDKTNFKIISAPGDLEIQLDKDENSRSSYRRIRRMCEEIKKVIAEK
ncbi:hypothetical protein SAMN04487995_3047 [Dyadobacter koreensis]|uniref:Lipoprotein n=1 Tax=Dyadobacter koreensis TaxID=408657 RepID=A0A1H6VAS9_9BACT|nr:hypothetical protein [Dyadobacter koreensis]SEJ01671.1 hypothetical protein SAMN04487995_3047 [Dyadobacter koreensis]